MQIGGVRDVRDPARAGRAWEEGDATEVHRATSGWLTPGLRVPGQGDTKLLSMLSLYLLEKLNF